MRMWMTSPEIMCRQHLLGEHVELHMLSGTIKVGKSIKGYVKNGIIESSSIPVRHKQLVDEMKKRGMIHKSELPEINFLNEGEVNREESLRELVSRCPRCRERFIELLNKVL